MISRTMLIATLLASAACSTQTAYDPYVAAVDNQVQTRSYQTRQIEATEYSQLMAAVISILQDYHFRIVDIDPDLGTITAYQKTTWRRDAVPGGNTSLTVMIREREKNNYKVRMNMSTGLKPDTESELYQQFFSALQRKLHDREAA